MKRNPLWGLRLWMLRKLLGKTFEFNVLESPDGPLPKLPNGVIVTVMIDTRHGGKIPLPSIVVNHVFWLPKRYNCYMGTFLSK